jgi:sugar lactone lactonase YvrE
MPADVAVRASASVGEGPLWDADAERLYWADPGRRNITCRVPVSYEASRWVSPAAY